MLESTSWFLWYPVHITVKITWCFLSDMLLQCEPKVLPPPPPRLVPARLPQETPGPCLTEWAQITEATTVGKWLPLPLPLNYQAGTKNTNSHPLAFSPQLLPADPHFRFSTECNTTLGFLPGRHGMHSLLHTRWHFPAVMEITRACCCDCRPRSRLCKGLWKCLWLIPGGRCSRPSGE